MVPALATAGMKRAEAAAPRKALRDCSASALRAVLFTERLAGANAEATPRTERIATTESFILLTGSDGLESVVSVERQHLVRDLSFVYDE
mmetsp:Transcript_1610/g.2189  ORF Transcript_1610/g.2189 Transcript_1610/m.2189 type:complete len:90 (-) Transcript_1610:340-609(-)